MTLSSIFRKRKTEVGEDQDRGWGCCDDSGGEVEQNDVCQTSGDWGKARKGHGLGTEAVEDGWRTQKASDRISETARGSNGS